MQLKHIDGGKDFDWGKASCYYAKHRDIYPPEFLNKVFRASISRCSKNVLPKSLPSGTLAR